MGKRVYEMLKLRLQEVTARVSVVESCCDALLKRQSETEPDPAEPKWWRDMPAEFDVGPWDCLQLSCQKQWLALEAAIIEDWKQQDPRFMTDRAARADATGYG